MKILPIERTHCMVSSSAQVFKLEESFKSQHTHIFHTVMLALTLECIHNKGASVLAGFSLDLHI